MRDVERDQRRRNTKGEGRKISIKPKQKRAITSKATTKPKALINDAKRILKKQWEEEAGVDNLQMEEPEADDLQMKDPITVISGENLFSYLGDGRLDRNAMVRSTRDQQP